MTEREVPQLSLAVSDPHAAPLAVHNAIADSGAHPHWFGMPVPSHVTPVPEQPPQSTVRVVPQLSISVSDPQLAA